MKDNKIKKLILLVFAYFIALNNVNSSNIAVSIKPLYSLIYMLVDNTDNLNLIVNDNSSIHDIDLTINQVKLIESSDIVIILSKSMESSLYKIAKKGKTIIVLDEVLNDVLYDTDYTSFSDSKKTNAKLKDYHFWLDIQKNKIMLQKLSNILIKQNPHNKNKYEKNLAYAIKELDLLDLELKQLLNKNIKHFMTYHNGWQYFILYYNLTSKGNIVIDSNSHHNADTQLSVKTLIELQKYIIKNNVKCIFSDYNFGDSALIELIKKENISNYILDEIGQNMPINKDLYANMMKKNIQEINKCI